MNMSHPTPGIMNTAVFATHATLSSSAKMAATSSIDWWFAISTTGRCRRASACGGSLLPLLLLLLLVLLVLLALLLVLLPLSLVLVLLLEPSPLVPMLVLFECRGEADGKLASLVTCAGQCSLRPSTAYPVIMESRGTTRTVRLLYVDLLEWVWLCGFEGIFS